MNWIEFKPTFLFLGRFLGFYLVGNLLYGLFITSYGNQPDPVTAWVTTQCADILSLAGWNSQPVHNAHRPTTSIILDGRAIVSVYEGCNGINVAIIFVSFLFAFGPYVRALGWFVPAGVLIIHLANLGRIILLFWVALSFPRFLYFAHKYLFTVVIYAVVFLMWLWWVWSFALRKNEQSR